MSQISPKDQVVPHSQESEKSVLGCILLDKESIFKVADFLEAGDFYHDHHVFIYEAALALMHRSEPIDMVTVCTQMQAAGKLEIVGGPEYLASLQAFVPTPTHIFQYAQSVKHRATLRKLIRAGNEITALGFDSEKPIDQLLEAAEKKLFAISHTFVKDRFVSMAEILETTYERISEIHENPEKAQEGKVQTHFTDLDDIFNGGFQPSDLIILAARPSMGKTALVLEFARRASSGMHGTPKRTVGIISLEMSKEQMVERIFCGMLKVDSWKLHKGKLEPQDFERLGPVMDDLASSPIFIDDSMGATIAELRAKVRRLKMEHGLDMLVIDYLQLMTSDNPQNRVQEISEVSRSLKEIARELHIPVIALSQLSRSVESRTDKRPILSDLRDSGSIEQDADAVMMLFRPDYYEEASTDEEKRVLEVNIAKHRNGRTGRVRLYFDREKMEFGDDPIRDQAGF